jgi:hypothetical protein
MSEPGSHETVTDEALPPVGEEIHLPGPSIMPLVLAIGITMSVIGITISPKILVPIGLITTVTTIFLWIRSTRSEIADLPPTHHHH